MHSGNRWVVAGVALALGLFASVERAGAVGMSVLSDESFIETLHGGAALSGMLDVEVGAPGRFGNATFDIVGLALQAGNASISLVTPALGVVGAFGGFLVPNVHVSVQQNGQSHAVTIPDLLGHASFANGSLESLKAGFVLGPFQQGGSALGKLEAVAKIERAIPEPTGFAVFAAGLAAVGVRVRRRSCS